MIAYLLTDLRHIDIFEIFHKNDSVYRPHEKAAHADIASILQRKIQVHVILALDVCIDSFSGKHRFPHVYLHSERLIASNVNDHIARKRPDRITSARRDPFLAAEMRKASDPVAAHRCSAAVAVEKHHFQRRLRPYYYHTVSAHPGVDVADFLRQPRITARLDLRLQFAFLYYHEIVATAVIF